MRVSDHGTRYYLLSGTIPSHTRSRPTVKWRTAAPDARSSLNGILLANSGASGAETGQWGAAGQGACRVVTPGIETVNSDGRASRHIVQAY